MNLEINLLKMYAVIRQAELTHQRSPNSVVLVAATKGQTVAALEEVYAAGQREFGESYVQEALAKMEVLNARHQGIIWHFIGRIQTNKAKLLAKNFHWVQSVVNLKQAELLSKHRPQALLPLNICLEINLDHESSKTGIDVNFDGILLLAQTVTSLPQLRLRGLMSIPAPKQTFAEQLATFNKLKEIYEKLNAAGLHLDTLSIGMSDDFSAAIAAGTTMVRIGSAIFGARAAWS